MKQASNLVNFISSKGSETYHNIILRIAQDFVAGGGWGEWIVGGLVASWLARSSQDIASCFWARHSRSASPLQGPATLMQAVSSHPGGIRASCYKNRDKLWPDGHFGSYEDFIYRAAWNLQMSHFFISDATFHLGFSFLEISPSLCGFKTQILIISKIN